MITTGTVTLPSGKIISAGQGACYGIGGDLYPVTIIGWTKSGKTLYYQSARAHATKGSDYYGAQKHLFVPNPGAPIKAATWRTGRGLARRPMGGAFQPKGSNCGYISITGYEHHIDPHF